METRNLAGQKTSPKTEPHIVLIGDADADETITLTDFPLLHVS